MASQHLAFSLSLHHRLAPAAGENFCWSPYSVASALGLAAAASHGPTREELLTALRIDGDGSPGGLRTLLRAATELDNASGGEEPVLAVANTLWAYEGLTLRQRYLDELHEWPGSALRNAPFRSEPDKARRFINADVAETTRELIPELMAPGSVDSRTVAALVNALYLKTSWTQPFAAAQPEPFHAPSGTRAVPTMRVTRRLGYAAVNGWQVVVLPAVGGVEAAVLLPGSDLAAVESTVDGQRLDALLSAPRQRRVALGLPKFEVTGGADLEAPLAALGVRRMFTADADFSALSDERMHVSSAVHQSVLRVDENGLEGAAATAMLMRLTAAVREEEPIHVDVDRPFMLVVRHHASGALYFLARVTEPA